MKFGSSDEKFDVWPWPFSTTIEIVTKFLLLNRSLASRVNNNIKPLEKGYEYRILILSYVSLYSGHFRR